MNPQTGILKQVTKLNRQIKERQEKVVELLAYLNDNPRNGFLVDYWDEPDSGGFKFDNVYDIIYVGSIVRTKYGEVCKVKEFDRENNLVIFEDEDMSEPLGPSRISSISESEEELAYHRQQKKKMSQREPEAQPKRLPWDDRGWTPN